MAGLFSSKAFTENIKISENEFNEFRNFVYEMCGIYLTDNRKFLVENRFGKRVNQLRLKSYAEYIKYIKYDPKGKSEKANLIELITTNETSFFRDIPQLKAFSTYTIPDLIKKARDKKKRELTIWSAGCSSGEEPYTLVILLLEHLKSEFPLWKISINATDLSREVIEKAKKATYSAYALRTTPDSIKNKYFKKGEKETYLLDDKITSKVKFSNLNLNDRLAVKRIPKSDCVFCRNVLIYFDKAMKKKVIHSFYDNLVEDGHLYVGHSESLHSITNTFKAIHHKGAISYRKL